MGCRAIPVATSDTVLYPSSSPSPHVRRPARLMISTWANSLKTLSFHWEAKRSAKTAAVACSALAAHWQLQAPQFDFSAIFFLHTPQSIFPISKGFWRRETTANILLFVQVPGQKYPSSCKASNKRFLPLEGGRGFHRQKRPTHLPVLISMRTDAVQVTSAPA